MDSFFGLPSLRASSLFLGVSSLGVRRRRSIGRRLVLSSGLSGSHDSLLKLSWPRSSGNGRFAMIGRSPQLGISTCHIYLLRLCGDPSNMALTCCRFLLRSGARGNSSWATVVADVTNGVVGYIFDIHVVDNVDIDVHHVAVIEKVSALPATAEEAHAEVAETVIDSAIESDLRTPIAVIENVSAVVPPPIGRSPEKSSFRW